MNAEEQYLSLLEDVLKNGRGKADRTGTGTRAVFGRQLRADLSKGFPLLTTKKVFLKGVIAELLWFLSGDTNERTLRDQGVNIWKEWADPETGELGRVYGAQWRRWRSVGDSADEGDYGEAYSAKVTDQIETLIADLKTNPTSRRHIVTAWNPGELDQMALPPCHCLFQFYCEELTLSERVPLFDSRDRDKMFQVEPLDQLDNPRLKALEEAMDKRNIPRYRLSCQLYQRSADIFLGVPFNIASYALLTMMVAQVCNMAPGDFVHTFGDLHLYNNHVEQAELQLSRQPRPLPSMVINAAVKDIFGFQLSDFSLRDYDPHPAIRAAVSV